MRRLKLALRYGSAEDENKAEDEYEDEAKAKVHAKAKTRAKRVSLSKSRFKRIQLCCDAGCRPSTTVHA